MRWFHWFRRENAPADEDELLDIDHIVAQGLRDPSSARPSINQLRRERKRLLRQQRSLDKQSRRPSTVDIRNMGRTGPQLGPYQLSQSMQQMNDVSQDSAFAEQEADIERRMKAVEHAIARLKAADR